MKENIPKNKTLAKTVENGIIIQNIPEIQFEGSLLIVNGRGIVIKYYMLYLQKTKSFLILK